MTIPEFETGKYYKYEPGPVQAVHIKTKTIHMYDVPGQVMVGETKPTDRLWYVTGTEDLSKYTEITEQEFIDIVEGA